MNVMRTPKPSFNRRALVTQAMQAAAATRAKAKLDQAGPICVYELCETPGVKSLPSATPAMKAACD